MQFLTLRYLFGNNDKGVFIGPYLSCVDGYDTTLVANGHREHYWEAKRRVNGPQPVFEHDSQIHDRHYGFISWDQFYAYWWSDDEFNPYIDSSASKWTEAGFVVLEYNIPKDEILYDSTQAVAPLHRYEPITCYTL